MDWDKLKEKMESKEFKELAIKHWEEYSARIEKKRERVSSEEYINWVYEFVSEHGYADDESALYVYRENDAENGEILGAFFDYVKDLAGEQRVQVVYDEECGFDNEEVVLKIKDRCFKLFRIFGQGTCVSISILEKEPNYNYVKLK